jgi:hypothetical protein
MDIEFVGFRDEVEFSIAPIEGAMLPQFEEAMRQTVVVFFYEKSNGDKRRAVGTINPELMPVKQDARLVKAATVLDAMIGGGDVGEDESAVLKELLNPPEKKAPERNPEWFNYYDLGSGGWRKFHVSKLIGYIKPQ